MYTGRVQLIDIAIDFTEIMETKYIIDNVKSATLLEIAGESFEALIVLQIQNTIIFGNVGKQGEKKVKAYSRGHNVEFC